jgi:WD40 repeat protein
MTTGPYQGLMPFTEDDAAYFFGRDADCAIITDNFIASRLTLLYAPSGVGKTSVLLAGVVHDLRTESWSGARPPEYLPVVVRQWTGDPVHAIDAATADAARAVAPSVPDPPADKQLVDRLRHWADALDVTLMLVLDQFEEFLLYQSGRPAAAEIARAMAARELRANYLLGLREDALASLDRFKGRVPNLFDNYLRLDYLDRDDASRAIVEPLEQWNREQPDGEMAIEPALVDAVIEEVATGRVALGRTGGGRGPHAQQGVETAFLQLVMTRLWEEERGRGSSCLRAQTLRDLGGAAKIIRGHVDGRLARLTKRQRDVAAAAFHQLVTPTGRKVARSLRDLAAYTGASEGELGTVLDALATGEARIVRLVEEASNGRSATYEVFHDVLAEAVLDWRARHDERRRRARLLRRGALAGLVIVAVIAGALLLAAHERDNAERARVSALLAKSQADLGIRPTAAVANALEAVEATDADSPEAIRALRTAIARSDLRGVLTGAPGPTSALRVSPDGRQLAAAVPGGGVLIWSFAHPADPVRLRPLGQAVSSIAFSASGDRVAVGGKSPDVQISGVRDGHRLRTLSTAGGEVRRVRWSPAGDRIVTVTQFAQLWDVSAAGGTPKPLGRADFAQWTKGGTRFVTATEAGAVSVWSAGGTLIRSFDEGGRIKQIGFLPDGSDVVVVHTDGRLTRLGSTCPGSPMRLAKAPAAARFSPDGRFVIMHDAAIVRVQNVLDCRISDLRPGALTVASALSTNGKIAAARGTDGAVRVWDVQRQNQLATLIADSPGGTELALRERPDGTHLVLTSGDDGAVRQWQVAAEPQASLLGRGHVLTAAFGGRPGQAVAATEDRVVRISDGEVAARSRRLPIDAAVAGGPGAAVALSTGGRLAIASGGGARIRPIGRAGEGANVVGLALSGDGERLAATYRDGHVSSWAVGTGKRLGTQPGPAGGLRPQTTPYALFATGGSSLLIVTDALYRANVPGGEPRRLAVAGAPRPGTTGGPPAAVSGDRLAAVAGGQVAVFDARSGRRLYALAGSSPSTEAIAFSPVGGVLATAGSDGVRLWDAATGEPMAVLAGGSYDAVSFDEDGRSVLAGGDGLGVQIFGCRPCVGKDELIRDAQRLKDNRALLPGAPEKTGERDAPFGGARATPEPVPTATPLPSEGTIEVPAPTATPQVAPEAPQAAPTPDVTVSGGADEG